MKLVYIYDEEMEDNQGVYIDGKYIIGEYYASFECAVEVARFFNPDIEVESWKLPRDQDGSSPELPMVLSDNFVDELNLISSNVED